MNRIPMSMLLVVALTACSSGGGASSSGSALHVTTTALPDGQVSAAYTASLSASGGTSPYQWAITSGALPSGLSLVASGAISGTPTAAGTSSFVVTVTGSASGSGTAATTASATLSITIQPVGSSASPLRITTTSLPGATTGAPYAAQLTSSGGTAPVSWALGAGTSLPPGLTLSSTGALAGTPSIAGSYGFTVVAVDSSSPQEIASAALSISVVSTNGTLVVSTANLPQGTVGTSYSQQLDATGGTTPYAWSVATGALPDGLTLSTSGLLSGTPTTNGSYTFTVQVADSSATPQLARATFTVTINPKPAQAVAITTGALAAATVGHPYQAQLQAAGGVTPYSWAVIAGALPDGLALSTSGAISGTPTSGGSFTFTVEVADASTPAQTASKQFTITVATPPGQTLSITTAMLPSGTVGTDYSATIAASGGTPPYAFSVVTGSLPPGLALASDGTISGKPTTSGMFAFTVRVTDSSSPALTSDRSLSILVSPAPGQLAITTAVLPVARRDSAYSATLTAANGTPSYVWSLTAGALPAGLDLSSAGVISGTPTESGTFVFTVTVVDSAATPNTASKQLTLFVR